MSIFQTSFVWQLRNLGKLILFNLPFVGNLLKKRSEEFALPPESEEVTFFSRELMLQDFIHKPQGNAPFPAILLNHGSEQYPKSMLKWAQPYINQGYVVFAPHRRGQGNSSDRGTYIMDLLNRESESDRGKKMVELQDIHQEDTIAALSYLKQLPYVDRNRIAITGSSFGGIQTILASEKQLGLRAAIAFAPAAMAWSKLPELRSRLIEAVRSTTIPILLVQAENDYDLSPTQAMARELEKANKPHKLVIFPKFGKTPEEGHTFGVFGSQIWGNEVFFFLDSLMS
jgi:carboxymethylenebutenolidase